MRRWVGFLGLLLVALVSEGCAPLKYSFTPVEGASSNCEDLFRNWRQAVFSGNHFDAQAWPPPGFPYLRVDRFLASFEFAQLSTEQRQEWLQRAHRKAVTAWRYEAESLGGNAPGRLAALQECGQQAIAQLQDGGQDWHRLDAARSVPDSYRDLARVVGLYPLMAPLVQWRAEKVMRELIENYQAPYQPAHPWKAYAPPETGEPKDFTGLITRARHRSALRIPEFSEEESRALFAQYAPTWMLETRDGNDVPGRPARGRDGELLFEPIPVVYTHLSYTWFGGQVLPQLNYLIWFAARPPAATVDIYAGTLDGFFWRVTLGGNGLPMIYDFVHSCGCYHQWLLVESGLRPVDGAPAGEEPLWIAGTVPQTDSGMTLYLSSGEHQLVASRMVTGQVADSVYRFQPYDDLRGRSAAGRRLFASDGLIDGTERSERFLLWPTGVVSAGAMRQWGQHAVAFTGRRHFDDPELLTRYFFSAPVHLPPSDTKQH